MLKVQGQNVKTPLTDIEDKNEDICRLHTMAVDSNTTSCARILSTALIYHNVPLATALNNTSKNGDILLNQFMDFHNDYSAMFTISPFIICA